MIKAAAAVITVTGFGMYGIFKAMNYKERADMLSDFIQAIEKMKIEMSYRRESLPELTARLAGAERVKHDGTSPSELFFGRVSEINGLSKNASLEECWIHAADDTYAQTCLTRSDTEAIKKLGHDLGSCGIDGQKRILELSAAELGMLLSEAESDMNTKGKMYVSLGFTIGITVVIILI